MEKTEFFNPDCKCCVASALVQHMSNISEEYYCAGWLHELEFTLWSMVLGGDRKFGMGVVTDEEVEKLRFLSEKLNGWFLWDEEKGETFVTMEEWTKIYSKEKGLR